jgi:hypothetical protein
MIWALLKAGQKLFKLAERLYCNLIISASLRVVGLWRGVKYALARMTLTCVRCFLITLVYTLALGP